MNILEFILFLFMAGLRETFNYPHGDRLVEQERKELESRAAEKSIVDDLRTKGF